MLAELYKTRLELEIRIDWQVSTIHHAAGDKQTYVRYGRGHRRVWGLTFEQAHTVAKDKLEKGALMAWDERNARKAIEALAAIRADLEWIADRTNELERHYREAPWSRFFLVTSSSGHVHSSMHCSTCYATTTYGWLPELSGLDEQAAVAELGPALCSVCFPDAPVEMVGGKITKAEAERRAR